jgi:hypothetical protein
MAWNSNLKRGTDLPTWDWLSFYPNALSYHGTALTYDGNRFIYGSMQIASTTATTAGTTQIWRYDTWSDGWQYLSLGTSGSSGADIEYDPVRNILWMTNGASTLLTWQAYNLNSTAQSVCGVTIQPYTLTQITPTLPVAPYTGGSIQLVEDVSFGEVMASGTISTGTSTTVFATDLDTSPLNSAYVGFAIRMTGGTAGNIGQRRTISATSTTRGTVYTKNTTIVSGASTIVVDNNTNLAVGMSVTGYGIGYGALVTNISGTTITLSVPNLVTTTDSANFALNTFNITVSSAFASTPAYGDTYVVEYPKGTATSGTTNSLTDTNQTWAVNQYANCDLVITGGTRAGERRRIASNTATVINTASTQTGLVATLATGVATVTLTSGSTANMCIGQVLTVTGGTGAFGANAVVQSIQSTTAFTASINHATAGSTTFSATYPASNTRVGVFGAALDSTSTYEIVPSSDFLYYLPGNTTTALYKIDLNTGSTAVPWIALTAAPNTINTGAQIMHGKNTAPFSLYTFRGNGNVGTLYRYDTNLNAWVTITSGGAGTSSGSGDTVTQGAGAAVLHDNNRIALHVQGTTRIMAVRLSDVFFEPFATLPYAAPVAYDGRRLVYLPSQDGVHWLYFQRAGGGEFYRCALEWY